MSPRGEGPLTMQIRAQSGREKSPKPKANGLQTAQNLTGPLYKVTGGHQPNLGSFGPSWGGAAAPPLAHLGPSFGRLVDAAFAMTVT